MRAHARNRLTMGHCSAWAVRSARRWCICSLCTTSSASITNAMYLRLNRGRFCDNACSETHLPPTRPQAMGLRRSAGVAPPTTCNAKFNVRDSPDNQPPATQLHLPDDLPNALQTACAATGRWATHPKHWHICHCCVCRLAANHTNPLCIVQQLQLTCGGIVHQSCYSNHS